MQLQEYLAEDVTVLLRWLLPHLQLPQQAFLPPQLSLQHTICLM